MSTGRGQSQAKDEKLVLKKVSDGYIGQEACMKAIFDGFDFSSS